MSADLINMLQHEFSDDAIAKIASFVGEGPAKTQKALGFAIPAIVAALSQKSQTSQGAADLLGLLKGGGFDRNAFGSLGSLLKAGSGASDALKVGAPVVSSLFGPRANGLTDWISNAAGVSTRSSASLLGVAAPFVLSAVGREASAGGFNSSSIAKLLGGQARFLRGVVPAGLATALGLTGWDEPARAYSEPARAYSEPARVYAEPARAYEQPGGLGWLKWLAPLLLLALALWAFNAWRTPEPPRALVGTAGLTPPAVPAALRTPALVKRTLSCGQELDMAPNGVEAGLIAYIDGGRAVDKDSWFTFDRLEFESASATLKPTSQAQLQNVAAILRCYPNVNLKIGGYTDNVGDPASNQRLSDARAQNTRQAVISHGIDQSRLAAEGFGEQFPVATNETEEGRQRNRRIDVRVTRK